MRTRKELRRKVIICIICTVVFIALFALALRLIEKHSEKDVQFGDSGEWSGNDLDTHLTIGGSIYSSTDDIQTVLLIGTDEGGENLGKAYSGELADFIMLLVIDNTTGKYGFFTIDRNTMTPITIVDAEGNFAMYETLQLCLSHWYGLTPDERNNYTVQAVSGLLGNLKIDHYYTLSMSDIGKINHAIGGVTVEIDTDMTQIDPAFVKGETVLLSDEQAEKYLRARYVLDDATNEARMKRQQQYMTNAFELLISQFRENPDYVNELYEELKGCLESNGGAKALSGAVNKMLDYENAGFIKFSGRIETNDTLGDGEEHEEFYIDTDNIVPTLRKVIDLKNDGKIEVNTEVKPEDIPEVTDMIGENGTE